jgi:hypothetical protein
MKARRSGGGGPLSFEDDLPSKYRVFPLKIGNLPYSFIPKVFVS